MQPWSPTFALSSLLPPRPKPNTSLGSSYGEGTYGMSLQSVHKSVSVRGRACEKWTEERARRGGGGRGRAAKPLGFRAREHRQMHEA